MAFSYATASGRMATGSDDRQIASQSLAVGNVVAYVGRVGVDGETFRARLARLIAERHMNPYSVARAAGLSRNAVVWLLDGTTKTPTIQTAEALAAVLGVSREFLLTGADPDEEDISTMEQLHAWEMKIARQRERYIRAILARQVAETIRPELPPDIAAAVERTARELVERAHTRAGTEANGPLPEARSLAS